MENNGHGSRCTCRVLAEAVGFDASVVSFAFCRSVLQRRWVVECDHACGSVDEPQESSDRWREFGKIDSVKAILIMNDRRG